MKRRGPQLAAAFPVGSPRNRPARRHVVKAIEVAPKRAQVAVDARVDPRNWQQVLFHLCANTDPGRDLLPRGGRIGFDATAKLPGDERNGLPVRPYPPPIEMSETVRRRVADRWREYGF